MINVFTTINIYPPPLTAVQFCRTQPPKTKNGSPAAPFPLNYGNPGLGGGADLLGAGCRHVAARAVAGVCSAHLLKHRHRHWCRRRHTEYTCTQSAQTQAHMHNALGAVASNRGGTACRRACLVHSCVCAPRSASKPRSQPTRRRGTALFIGRRRSCDCEARRGEANTHGSGFNFLGV